MSDLLDAQTSAEYMITTDISVNSVAQLLGYKDPANYRRSFERWFLVTPAAYREQHRPRA
ncbi:MAG: helix-turn-helix transcriptional regulator [Gammaproteobacteria bacterium]|nr:helix-turn-helix transcriptional regulator [Gammaproteobacteria bacterium]MBT5722651.1 helix-turn-helix transcriptional regulator [Gammaproteobacteria bacterium]MBT6890936.1 helix-turn-helix transcriptional regulator [Gammaproteobacteria bacterium]MBT7878142.1 helix-turn-helix transcriptional regulator [Gammaproteobacteria bacterium]